MPTKDPPSIRECARGVAALPWDPDEGAVERSEHEPTEARRMAATKNRAAVVFPAVKQRRDTVELVGRDAERAALAAFVEDPGPWPAGLVLVGEAGAGKTTLWREALSRAERSAVTSC